MRSPLGTSPTALARAARSEPVNTYRPSWYASRTMTTA